MVRSPLDGKIYCAELTFVTPTEKWRLDRLLQRKAKEGVQIFVIVYKEVSNDFT